MAKNITKLKHRFPLRQVRQIPRIFRRIWPVIFLTIISLLLCYSNYEPGTTLIGWDNLQSELDLGLNIKRAIFAVWQEYQSLGLLGGMAHAADLPRLIIMSLLQRNSFVSTNLLRYILTFVPLIIGPIGTYYFIYDKILKEKLDAKTSQVAAFLGGVFYLLNLSTLQTFFTPFETFTWFYGTFPFLLYFIADYFENPNQRTLITLFFISLFSTPAFYVETIFIVFSLVLLPIITEAYFRNKNKIKSISNIVKMLIAFVVPNLFWLFSVIFFVFNSNHVNENAKINLLSSPETYYRNLEYGNFKDIAVLKGFWFSFLDLTSNQKFDYLLAIWRNHTSTPLITIIGAASFLLIIIGLYYANKKNFPWTKSLIAIFFLCFFFLIGGGLLIGTSFPIVSELFRSPFTKFSTPLSFLYACFFATGTVFLLDIFSFLHNRFTYLLTTFTVVVFFILFMSPAFSGNLIGSNMRQNIPEEYQELFSYLRSQNQNARIANFPQNTFWGWEYYDWGYRGSGFLWYGIKQPILDRAFDVWNKDSETYYEEISSALFSGDQSRFESLLDKYDIKWLLLDKHVISPDSLVSLGTDTLEKFLKNSNKFSEAKNFNDKIYLYSVKNTHPSQDFLSTSAPANLFFPFASLSLRPNTDWVYKAEYVSNSQPISAKKGDTLNIPSLSETENELPVRIEYQKLQGYINIRLTPVTPTLIAGTKQIDLPTKPLEISIPANSNSSSFVLQLNHEFLEITLPAEILEFSDYYPLATVYLPTKDSFPILLYDGSDTNTYDLTSILSQTEPTQCYAVKPNRKIEKITTPDSITLLGTDVVGCLSTPLPSIPQDNLISLAFTYSSPTFTLANVNVSGKDFNTSEIPQALEPNKDNQRARQFVSSTGKYQQLNLILEAADTKSVQEIQYKDIVVSTHPLVFSETIRLPKVPSREISLSGDEKRLQVSLPLTDTQFDIEETPESNSLFPENRNCDQFNAGSTVKKTDSTGFLYQSKNAVECDYLNLRNFDHSLNYLISFDYTFQKGLPMTTCFENYTTRRCDVFERLQDTKSVQSLIQPIANPNEAPGYTLHTFTQSIGSRISSGLLKSLSIRPIPFNFIQSLSISSSSTSFPTSRIISTSHPAEFIYKVSVSSDASVLNLFQTKSPYWKAIIVSDTDFVSSPWLNTIKIFFTYPLLQKLSHHDGNLWYNSWDLPKGDTKLIILYIPQYLEFLGFLAIPLTLIIFILLPILARQLKRLHLPRKTK